MSLKLISVIATNHFTKNFFSLIIFLFAAHGIAGELTAAINAGDLQQVQQIVAQHPNSVMEHDPPKYQTPLQLAIEQDKKEIVLFLIAHHSELNAADGEGLTALHYAVRANRIDYIDALLAAHADLRAQTNQNETPVLFADSISVLEYLSNHSANIFDVTRDSATLLQKSIRRGNPVPVIRWLVEHGLDVNAMSTMGDSPLREACVRGDIEVISLLLDHGAKTNVCNHLNKETPLLQVVKKDSGAIVELLLRHGADPNARNTDGYTALHGAAASGNRRVIQLLLAHGADINAHNDRGITPLWSGLSAIVRGDMWIDDSLTRGNHGIQSFARANDSIGAQLVEFLIGSGANVNAQDTAGKTPLYIAAKYGLEKCCRVMIAHGADPSTKDHDGKSAVDVAGDAVIKKIVKHDARKK